MSKINNYNYVSACSDFATSANCYTLLNRQEPIHARISTNNERDRRPIDPPPIIQIRLNNATSQQTDTFHQNSYFYMCANLAHPSNDQEIYTPTHNALSGQTVSSMYKLKDIDNHDGAFFIFGDLSVKVEGHFRLKLSLFEITLTGAVCLQSIFTAPFVVYPAKKFPGTLESTFLSRSFSDQGARIRIRKENRAQPSTIPKATLASQQPRNLDVRKRKLEIQTESTVLRTAPQPIKAYNTTSPMMTHPSAATTIYYTERRASITSSGTESSSEGHGSPIIAPFGSPGGLSLPPLSPPQQSYDKLFGVSYCTYSMSPSSPPLQAVDPSLKLPPIRHVLHKRQKLARSEEEDAVLAMMQLSHHY